MILATVPGLTVRIGLKPPVLNLLTDSRMVEDRPGAVLVARYYERTRTTATCTTARVRP